MSRAAIGSLALLLGGCQLLIGYEAKERDDSPTQAAGQGGSVQGGAQQAGGSGGAVQGGAQQGGAQQGGAAGQAGQAGAGQAGAGQAGAGQAGEAQGGAGQAGEGGSVQGGAQQGGAAGQAGAAGHAGAAGQAGAGGAACGQGAPFAVCTSTCDCGAAQVCGGIDLDKGRSLCTDPNPGKKPIGGACTFDDGCESNYCDLYTNYCSLFCRVDADCGDDAVCLANDYGDGFSPGQCMKRCQRNADCPVNAGSTRVCMLMEHPTENVMGLGCNWLGENPPGSDGSIAKFGEVTDDVKYQCDTQFFVDVGGKLVCSRPCVDINDCEAPLPNCTVIMVDNPKGVGTTPIKACID